MNALLRCIFPYHDTNIFVRALQLLRLREETNRWHWLYPLQNPGVPLSKGALALRCAENLGFMKFLCVMNKKIIKVWAERCMWKSGSCRVSLILCDHARTYF